MPAISYRDIPFYSDLFCDYVSSKPTLQNFYNGSFRSPEDILAHTNILRRRDYDRDYLADVLTKQNASFGAGEKTFTNIAKLRKSETFAIVTGQQVGLFGGPLYTIYKIITALQLCESLRTQHAGCEFIPVFWLETEDHDFDEANHAWLIDGSGALLRAGYEIHTDEDEKARTQGPTGAVVFDEQIVSIVDSIEKNLPATEFHETVITAIRGAYSSGTTFSKAFAKLIQILFPEAGIVCLDPMDRMLKEMLTPIFRRELEYAPRTCEAVVQQSVMLEQKYHAQVKPRVINLFYFWKGGRFPIEFRKELDSYWLKGTRQYFTKDELFRSLKEHPDYFTPNVVLRPICQDLLLPTAMYVAGPGEIAYFAQFKPVYNIFGVPMPIIYPRASVTILEERFEKTMEKFSLTLNEIFSDVQKAREKSAQTGQNIPLEETFGAAHSLITEAFESARPAIEAYDMTLLHTLETAKQKAQQAMDVLGDKITAAAVRANTTAATQMDKLIANIAPNEKPQERSLNILYYLNKYGMDFCETLKQQISLDTTNHQIVSPMKRGGGGRR